MLLHHYQGGQILSHSYVLCSQCNGGPTASRELSDAHDTEVNYATIGVEKAPNHSLDCSPRHLQVQLPASIPS